MTLGTEQKSFDLPLRALLRAREDVDDSSDPDETIITRRVKTGGNQQPLGPRKRPFPDQSRGFVPVKMPKNADDTMADHPVVHDGLLISGHEFEEQSTDTEQRYTLGNITNSDHGQSRRSTLEKGRLDRPYFPTAPRIRTRRNPNSTESSNGVSGPIISEIKEAKKALTEGRLTQNAFEKVRNKFQLSLDNLQKDRDTLSKRWEADAQLKEPAAMDELTQLSEHLGTVEEGLKQTIKVMERIVVLT